jgi:hypothetical protein
MPPNNAHVTEQVYDPPPQNRRGKRCLAAAVGTVTLLMVGLFSAVPAYASLLPGCHSVNEVGDIATTCINLEGTGLFVNEIDGAINFTGSPNPGMTPQSVCQANFVAFGTLASGQPYSAQGSTPCNLASPTPTNVYFFPNLAFKANTQICLTATVTAPSLDRSYGPVCKAIPIHPVIG